MKSIIIFIALLLVVGCSGTPRYRTGGQVKTEKKSNKQTAKIDPRLSTDDNIKFGRILQSYLGRPHVSHSNKKSGLDCSKFTRSAYKDFNGLRLPRTAAEQFKSGRKIRSKDMRYGDLVFYKTTGKKISHVGIYVGNNQFIHVSSSKGVIVTNMKEKYWARRFVGARRVIE